MLLEKGRMPPEENLEVVVLTGDGAAYGMGLSVVKQPLDIEHRATCKRRSKIATIVVAVENCGTPNQRLFR